MAENKTQLTDASVEQYLAAIEDEARRKDCTALVKIMTKATKLKPKMWGTAIVGFGIHRYKYDSGREGETCLIGFSSRKGDISIYGTGSAPKREELLSTLGKHRTGKGCLYVGKLKDVDVAVLEALIVDSVRTKVG
ncbi:DUF1801 domain-containing protein [uncultured Nevskia sp.]|uniref:DUF1801 domain-containing protein n=1 Tax=uncultured Nevskia sp. TaxID=228950 RepID=UPI0025F19382|nr:DUF1801 domain-containing protein [uncultured Nevskia sp.]